MILELNDKKPYIEKAAFLAENATIIGDVTLKEGVSVWYGAVLRGDEDSIVIGKDTNVQDNTVVHADPDNPVVVGERVTIGHQCIIHGCMIGDDCLIGMGAIIMNGAKIGKNCIVGAGALVTERKEFPDGSVIIGSPAKIKSEVDEAGLKLIRESAEDYIRGAKLYSENAAPKND